MRELRLPRADNFAITKAHHYVAVAVTVGVQIARICARRQAAPANDENPTVRMHITVTPGHSADPAEAPQHFSYRSRAPNRRMRPLMTSSPQPTRRSPALSRLAGSLPGMCRKRISLRRTAMAPVRQRQPQQAGSATASGPNDLYGEPTRFRPRTIRAVREHDRAHGSRLTVARGRGPGELPVRVFEHRCGDVPAALVVGVLALWVCLHTFGVARG
jgi:hypothetical protein